MLEQLFPGDVVTVEADDAAWRSPLLPGEEAQLGPVSDGRRREFAAGRTCAREALTRLDLPAGPLLRRADRAPDWPEGAVGSISHCPGFCGAAVALRERYAGLGLDVERSGRARAELARRVCTPGERERLGALGSEAVGLVFAVKEAFYKAWNPGTGAALGFQDVETEIDLPAGRFIARLAKADAPALAGRREAAGALFVGAELLAAGLVVPAPD
jgi:4'-phosphopantetheinyl transferase EntD